MLDRLAPGAIVVGRYRVERPLGAGAMGAVYRVTTQDGSAFALKVVPNEGVGDAERERFDREARALARVDHPNVVRVFDHGVDEALRVRYVLMEVLSGEDLAATITRLGPLTPLVAVRIALQAARGLAALHAAGVVHRDVKPSNLFLHQGSGGVTVKVCDLGVAKLDSAEALTASGSLVGTPLFMPPEQLVDSKRIDERADVWSLGMSLFDALAGQSALAHVQSLPELLEQLVARDLPSLQLKAPWVDPGIVCVVHGTLIRDTASRCPSMVELAAALERHVHGSAELEVADLVGVDSATRARSSPPAPAPKSWADVIASWNAPDPAVGKVLAEKYLITRVLAQGGMGAVYVATSRDGREVAVKVIRDDLMARNRDAVRRFVREARAARDVVHPNAVEVLDVGTDPHTGMPFIVMELLRGRDLSEWVRALGALDPKIAARVVVDASRGVGAAHARGIIHRDIKPANIFLHEDDAGTVTVKICDFGVAKRSSEGVDESTDLTRTGGMLGSPLYMSPEQARNAKQVDVKTDVWALSLSLYEALTGRRPWPGCTTLGELILAICTDDLAPLPELAPWVDAGLAAIVRDGTARDPLRRTANVDDLVARLERFAATGPLRRESIVSAADGSAASSLPARVSIGAGGATLGGESTVAAVASVEQPARSGRRARVVGGVVLVAAVAAAAMLARPHQAGQQRDGDRAAAAKGSVATNAPEPSGSAEAPAVAASSGPAPPAPAAPPSARVAAPPGSVSPRVAVPPVSSGAPTSGASGTGTRARPTAEERTPVDRPPVAPALSFRPEWR